MNNYIETSNNKLYLLYHCPRNKRYSTFFSDCPRILDIGNSQFSEILSLETEYTVDELGFGNKKINSFSFFSKAISSVSYTFEANKQLMIS